MSSDRGVQIQRMNKREKDKVWKAINYMREGRIDLAQRILEEAMYGEGREYYSEYGGQKWQRRGDW